MPKDAKHLFHAIEQRVAAFTAKATKEEIGRVVEVGDGVARLVGLPSVGSMEMIEFFCDRVGGAEVGDGVGGLVGLTSVGSMEMIEFFRDRVRGTGKESLGQGVVLNLEE